MFIRNGKAALRKVIGVLPRDARLQIEYWLHPDRYSNLREAGGTHEHYDTLKCVFVHVPKSAGTSVRKTLFGNSLGGHKSVAFYKKMYGPIDYSKRFSFTFVRNPYSRIVSAFTYLKNGGMNSKDAQFAKEHLCDVNTFEEFVLEWLSFERRMAYEHFVPQVDFVCDRGKIGVNFVGKFENLDKDFDYIARRLNLFDPSGAPIQLMHANSTKRKRPVEAFYTPEIRNKISYLYREDFDTFKYDIYKFD